MAQSLDLDYIRRHIEFSASTFGPGPRLGGILSHIRKELMEVEQDPTDVEEWIDVMILALDGAWRSGASPEVILQTMHDKLAKNLARLWPDWRDCSQDQPIEHVR